MKAHFRQPDGLWIDDKQFNAVVQHLLQDQEDDVKNIIQLINQGIVEDSSEVSSHRSFNKQTDAESEQSKDDFSEQVKKPYDGDHSDLALSSQGSQIAQEDVNAAATNSSSGP